MCKKILFLIIIVFFIFFPSCDWLLGYHDLNPPQWLMGDWVEDEHHVEWVFSEEMIRFVSCDDYYISLPEEISNLPYKEIKEGNRYILQSDSGMYVLVGYAFDYIDANHIDFSCYDGADYNSPPYFKTELVRK